MAAFSTPAVFSPITGLASWLPWSSMPSTDIKVVAYYGRSVNVEVPGKPLKQGSLKIVSDPSVAPASRWSDSSIMETYGLMQEVIQKWRTKGIDNFFIYSKQHGKLQPIDFEMVPYPSVGSSYRQQFGVLWNITFNSSNASTIDKLRVANEFKDAPKATASSHFEPTETIAGSVSSPVRVDTFCREDIKEKQLVYSGKEINIYYDYAPLDRYHFLIVPKRHFLSLSEMTSEEFVEAMQDVQKLIAHFDQLGGKFFHLFLKDGERAGRSVPHLHFHLVFSESLQAEIRGKLNVFGKMTFGPSRLPPEELERRVSSLRGVLKEILEAGTFRGVPDLLDNFQLYF